LVDEDLLAGAVVRVGSRVYDASLRTQIARLAERMAA
jgi:F0F1-type ATP synthase delta subunit